MGFFNKKPKIVQGITVENLSALQAGMTVKEAVARVGQPQFAMDSAAAFSMFGGGVPAWAKGKQNWVYKTPFGEFQLIVQDRQTVVEVQSVAPVIAKINEGR